MGMGIARLMTGAGAAQGLETLLKQRLMERQMALQEQAQRENADYRNRALDVNDRQHGESLQLQALIAGLGQRDKTQARIDRQADQLATDLAPGTTMRYGDTVETMRQGGRGDLLKARPMGMVPSDNQEPGIKGLRIGTPDQMGARPITGDYASGEYEKLPTASQQFQMDSAKRSEESLEMQARRLEAALSKAGGSGGVQFTPEALDMAAMAWVKTGQLLALGMGAANDKKLIVNRAAELYPGHDVAGAGAEFKSNVAALNKVTTRLATTQALANQASMALQQVARASAEYPRGGSPLVNRYTNWLNRELKGSAPLSKLEVFIYSAARDYARTTSGGAESAAQTTDTANAAADALLNAAQGMGQMDEVLAVMQTDMDNAMSTLEDERKALLGRTKKKPGEPDAPKVKPGGDKAVTLAQIQAVAKKNGTTVEQETARAQAEGFIVR